MVTASIGGCTSGASNSTRGLVQANTSRVDYFEFASAGNATTFANLSSGRDSDGALANATRAVFAGGEGSASFSDVIDYFTISSIGNATDFGDLHLRRRNDSGCSSSTRGTFNMGLKTSSLRTNIIDYITIASTGNASDFGDLTTSRTEVVGLANAHGGLQ